VNVKPTLQLKVANFLTNSTVTGSNVRQNECVFSHFYQVTFLVLMVGMLKWGVWHSLFWSLGLISPSSKASRPTRDECNHVMLRYAIRGRHVFSLWPWWRPGLWCGRQAANWLAQHSAGSPISRQYDCFLARHSPRTTKTQGSKHFLISLRPWIIRGSSSQCIIIPNENEIILYC